MKFSIGIDLGTTHSALAYSPISAQLRQQVGQRGGGATHTTSQILALSQNISSLRDRGRSPLLPSCIYVAPSAESDGALLLQTCPGSTQGSYSVGAFARERALSVPDRVVQSAKSWLAFDELDQSAASLPWLSADVSTEEKLSPTMASTIILQHCAMAWNETFPDAPIHEQHVTVTLPASFDFAAAERTREAALLAGLPANLTLLEEPQAAFYAWLESLGGAAQLLDLLPALSTKPQRILVIDVGGGTTDLSIFEIDPIQGIERLPPMRRLSVSDHLLLGGDNIDHAIVAAAEEQFGVALALSSTQKLQLLGQARKLKEALLSGQVREEHTLSVTGSGANLFAQSSSCSFTAKELEQLVLEGFFPICAASEGPHRDDEGAALLEFGLPFASDPAITRHLAAFLAGESVDAVLFNGGTLTPQILRERIVHCLRSWQSSALALLPATDLDLAVARGAAHYGALKASRGQLVEAHAARSLLLKAPKKGEKKSIYVCLMPQGALPGDKATIRDLPFEARVNSAVQFELFTTRALVALKPGEIFNGAPTDLRPLPRSHAYLESRRLRDKYVPIALEAELSDTGMLMLSCYERSEQGQRWQIRFRAADAEQSSKQQSSKQYSAPEDFENAPLSLTEREESTLPKVFAELEGVFQKKGHQALAAKGLASRLEKLSGRSKKEWSAPYLRELWNPLALAITKRARSAEHEVQWFQLSGFALRPGFGVPGDDLRMREFWRVFESGLVFPKETRVKLEWTICLRRLSAGLGAEEQRELHAKLESDLQRGDNLIETLRLVSSLERLDHERKKSLGEHMLTLIEQPKLPAEHIVAALGRLGTRTPLSRNRTHILPAELVASWCEKLLQQSWKEHQLRAVAQALLQLGRQMHPQELCIEEGLFERICLFARECAISGDYIARYVLPEGESSAVTDDAAHNTDVAKAASLSGQGFEDLLFGESLPAGVRITL